MTSFEVLDNLPERRLKKTYFLPGTQKAVAEDARIARKAKTFFVIKSIPEMGLPATAEGV